MRVDLGEQEHTEIGFAPLIDCIFLLLIFFLVATSFKTQEENKQNIELPIDLPVSSASFDGEHAEQSPVIIGVDMDGQFYWFDKEVSAQQLRDNLRDVKQKTPGRRIRVDGDRLTPYQNIVHVLDICQFEGFTNIGVHTRK